VQAIEVNRLCLNWRTRHAALDKIDILNDASGFACPTHVDWNIKRHAAFPSKILRNRRDVLVYLPRGYRRFSRWRYPVLYLQDGQNVFDAATAFLASSGVWMKRRSD